MSKLSDHGTERSQAIETEPNGSDLDEGLATFRQILIIAGQAVVADQTTERALDFPTVTLDLETAFGQNLQDGFAIHERPLLPRLIARFGKDLGVPAQECFDPLNEWAGVAVIGTQMEQAGKTSDEFLQEQSCSVAITNVGGMNQDGQNQALRVNEQVPFATEGFFPRRRNRVLGLAPDWS